MRSQACPKPLGATLALLLLSLWFAAAAPAEIVSHPYLPGRFPLPEEQGKPVTPPPLPTGALTGYFTSDRNFNDPCGLAVSAQGDIFVSDYHHDDIDVFNSNGEPQGRLPDVASGNGPCGLALGPGSLYVNVWHESVVRVGGPVIDSHGSTGVAVDPGDGRVYVDDRSYVAVYEASGEPVLVGGEPMKIGFGSLGSGFGVAVSNFGPTDGYVYVPDAASNTVKVYDPTVSLTDPVQAIDGAGTPEKRFVHLEDTALAIEQSSGHVFLAEQLVADTYNPPAAVYEFDRFGNYRGALPHSLVSGVPTGIAIDESSEASKGDIYVTTGDEAEGGVYAFGPAPPSSAIEVEKASSGGGTVLRETAKKGEPAGIDCGSTCANEFATGSQVVLRAEPDAHSAFTGWLVNGAPSATCEGTGKCVISLKADTKVTASFERLPQRVLTVHRGGDGDGTVLSKPAGIDCGSTCSEEFSEGLTVTLEAAAEPYSSFAGWSVTGEPSACPGTGSCQVQMNADVEVTATFAAIPQETLEVTRTGSGAGTVTIEPGGIACGGSCAASFDQGSSVVLKATADPGSSFAGWSGGGCSGAGSCEVTLSESRQVQASFVQNLRQVTVAVGGPGSGEVTSEPAGIACGGACSSLFVEGTAVTLSAHPAPGSEFAGWSGACTGKRLCQIDLRQDVSVGAEFRVARRTLAVSVTGSGNGTVSDPALGIACGLACSGVYNQGTVANLVAQPAAGSVFAGWQGCPRASGDHCAVPLQGDETVGAVFREIPSLDLGPPVIRGKRALIEADVSSPGTIRVRGKGVKGSTLHVSGEAPVILRVPLSKKGKRRLAKRQRLEVSVTVTFKPAEGGAPVTARRTLIFATGGKR